MTTQHHISNPITQNKLKSKPNAKHQHSTEKKPQANKKRKQNAEFMKPTHQPQINEQPNTRNQGTRKNPKPRARTAADKTKQEKREIENEYRITVRGGGVLILGTGIDGRDSLKELGRKREVAGEEIEGGDEGPGGEDVGVEMSHIHGGRSRGEGIYIWMIYKLMEWEIKFGGSLLVARKLKKFSLLRSAKPLLRQPGAPSASPYSVFLLSSVTKQGSSFL